jgi:predicted metal-dependent enzyme (double-stranded beta helix superfamily)
MNFPGKSYFLSFRRVRTALRVFRFDIVSRCGLFLPQAEGLLMVKKTTYTFERFIADVRQVFASSKDPRSQAQSVVRHMKELLAVPGWIEEKADLPAKGGYGRLDLYVDEEYEHPGPGFLAMCAVQPTGSLASKAPGTSPHDHGASWVVYGVYKGAIRQTKWRWVYPEGTWTSPELKPVEQFVQKKGEIAFFLPGEIHLTLNVVDERSLVLRLEAQNLDRVARHRYDLQTNFAVLQPAG